ncbi:TetR/AcrR family transcriptional regulator [Novosphingobium sp. B 225]|uniref:TetR/AcrR family transcriptional regulator n=1 Tax=Novosphingobium sp. B 225 TaxID=1961849 RepID=UPI000B4B7F36|nr:TetR/AcrR family transcriptional regulator [Novosphingobium sp. B 225]
MAGKVQTSEQRRRTIVATARAAFLRHGYGNTSMSAIAASLGGSKTTLWTYFPGKRALFDAVVDDLVARYGEALRLPLPPDADPRTTLEAFAISIISTITRPQIVAMHRMVTGEAGRFPELGRALLERGMKRGQARLADWIAAQMERGKLRMADSALAAVQFGGLCQCGAFQQFLLGARSRPAPAEIEAEAVAATDTFLRAYAP